MQLAEYPSIRHGGWLERRPWQALLLPYAAMLLLFIFLPLGNLAIVSFHENSATGIWGDALTLANYDALIDPFYFYLVVRTLRIGAISTIVCILLGYPMAYFLARASRQVVATCLFLLVMPLMVSTVIRAFGWMVILGRNGLINNFGVWLGVGPLVNIMQTEAAVIIGLVQIVLPLMVLPLMAAIEKIPRSVEEAAANLGCWPMLAFMRIIVPLSTPGLISGTLLCFTVSISVVVTPALLGGRRARMFGNEIYDQVIASLNWPMAASLSMVLILLTFVLTAIGIWAARRRRPGARS